MLRVMGYLIVGLILSVLAFENNQITRNSLTRNKKFHINPYSRCSKQQTIKPV